jgi:hypothetical protein
MHYALKKEKKLKNLVSPCINTIEWFEKSQKTLLAKF